MIGRCSKTHLRIGVCLFLLKLWRYDLDTVLFRASPLIGRVPVRDTSAIIILAKNSVLEQDFILGRQIQGSSRR